MKVWLRRATEEDETLVLAIENEPSQRAASFRKTPISAEEHARWFKEKMEDPDSAIFVVRASQTPAGPAADAGVLRLYRAGEEAVLSVGVTESLQGMGIGTLAIRGGLAASIDLWGCDKVVAFVGAENKASRRAFEKAGFKAWGSAERGWQEMRC